LFLFVHKRRKQEIYLHVGNLESVDVTVPKKKIGSGKRSLKKAKPARLTEPEILKIGSQKMAVLLTKGDPNKVAAKSMPALYGSVYKLKFELKKKGTDFKVGKLRARWPDAHLVSKDQWTGIWGLPIPGEVTEIPQKIPESQVKIETWQYGTVAQILHLGPYKDEGPTVERLHQFIKDSGYEIAGTHEEEYLTSPKAKVQKTLIRYPVKKKEQTT